MCNVGDTGESNDACTKHYTDSKIQSAFEAVKMVADTKIHEIDTKISKMSESVIENAEFVNVCRINLQTTQDRIDENTKKISRHEKGYG